jgi:glycosyltransferase involved in cell wall biosynthesis
VERAEQTTVVIAAWGGYVGGQLEEAVASVRDQDAPVAIVVIDNASDVPLPDLGDVELVRSPRRLALGAARNLGLAQVKTPYVLVWDADDVMLPGTLDFLERAIESDPDLAAFGAAILESPARVRHRWPRRWIARLARARTPFALFHCVWSLYPTTGATIMRTELVRAAGGYADTESGEDWVLGASLAFRGRIGWSERPGRLYRIHAQSVLARHTGLRHVARGARAVRKRLRDDTGLPRWTRAALPLILVGQYVAIGLHVGLGFAHRLRRSRESHDRGRPG